MLGKYKPAILLKKSIHVPRILLLKHGMCSIKLNLLTVSVLMYEDRHGELAKGLVI